MYTSLPSESMPRSSIRFRLKEMLPEKPHSKSRVLTGVADREISRPRLLMAPRFTQEVEKPEEIGTLTFCRRSNVFL